MSDFKTLLAVGDMVQPGVVTIETTQSVKNGAVTMTEKNTTSLLVIDAVGKLIGIVTEGDIVRRAVGKGLDVSAATIGDIMSPDPVSINHDESIFEARNTMTAKKLGHLIVVKDGKPLGVLTSQAVLGA